MDNRMGTKLGAALKLIDGGASVAEAAKLVGISRQAVYAGLKALATQTKRELRLCSECGVPLGANAGRATTMSSGTGSGGDVKGCSIEHTDTLGHAIFLQPVSSRKPWESKV